MIYRIAFVFLLLFTGCSDYPIYKEKKESLQNIHCLNIIALEDSDIQIAKKYLNNFEFSETCKFKFEIKPHLIHKCSNPKVKSLGSDFDGYVLIKLSKNNKLYFRSQVDFKGDEYAPHLKKLLIDFIEELH